MPEPPPFGAREGNGAAKRGRGGNRGRRLGSSVRRPTSSSSTSSTLSFSWPASHTTSRSSSPPPPSRRGSAVTMASKRLYLAVDCGGTKAAAVICDQYGQLLSRGYGGPSNYTDVGLRAFLSSVETAVISALHFCAVPTLRPSANNGASLDQIGEDDHKGKARENVQSPDDGVSSLAAAAAAAAAVGGGGGVAGQSTSTLGAPRGSRSSASSGASASGANGCDSAFTTPGTPASSSPLTMPVVQPGTFEAAWFGIAGVDAAADVLAVSPHLASLLGLPYPSSRLIVANDTSLLAAPVTDPSYPAIKSGVVVIAGTGSIVMSFRQRKDGMLRTVGRIGGFGWLLGDEGSGYAVGRDAIRRILDQADMERLEEDMSDDELEMDHGQEEHDEDGLLEDEDREYDEGDEASTLADHISASRRGSKAESSGGSAGAGASQKDLVHLLRDRILAHWNLRSTDDLLNAVYSNDHPAAHLSVHRGSIDTSIRSMSPPPPSAAAATTHVVSPLAQPPHQHQQLMPVLQDPPSPVTPLASLQRELYDAQQEGTAQTAAHPPAPLSVPPSPAAAPAVKDDEPTWEPPAPSTPQDHDMTSSVATLRAKDRGRESTGSTISKVFRTRSLADRLSSFTIGGSSKAARAAAAAAKAAAAQSSSPAPDEKVDTTPTSSLRLQGRPALKDGKRAMSSPPGIAIAPERPSSPSNALLPPPAPAPHIKGDLSPVPDLEKQASASPVGGPANPSRTGHSSVPPMESIAGAHINGSTTTLTIPPPSEESPGGSSAALSSKDGATPMYGAGKAPPQPLRLEQLTAGGGSVGSQAMAVQPGGSPPHTAGLLGTSPSAGGAAPAPAASFGERKHRLASLAPIIFHLAFTHGDPLSLQIVTEQAQAIAKQIATLCASPTVQPQQDGVAPTEPSSTPSHPPATRAQIDPGGSVLCVGGSLVGVKAYRELLVQKLKEAGLGFARVQYVDDPAKAGASALSGLWESRIKAMPVGGEENVGN